MFNKGILMKSLSIHYCCTAIFVFTLIACNSGMEESKLRYPNQRWNMLHRGELEWVLNQDSLKAHMDNIEMSGRKVSAIINYGIDSLNKFSVTREVIWPCLRINLKKGDPDWMKYRAYLKRIYKDDVLPRLTINRSELPLSSAVSVKLNGTIIIAYNEFENVEFKRTIFPSVNQAMLLEQWKLTNHSKRAIPLSISEINHYEIENGYYGQYEIGVKSDNLSITEIQPGETIVYGIFFEAHKARENISFNIQKELKARNEFLSEMKGSLQLNTPDSLLNSAFLFAKIRTSESLFETKIGLMHSPGGGRYYAGVWANDQVEYAGPFFPFLGYKSANEASLNAYTIFAADMKPGESKPIWSSHEMEGDLTCCGADRGDAAMYLFGASRFLLALGDKQTAIKFFPALDWCVEYNHHRLNSNGVVASETDEMEGRIPTGSANLATSSLYYGGLVSAAALMTSVGISKVVAGIYWSYANPLRDSIESYFGANVEGFNTYQYFKGNDKLRHWICIPMTVGLKERQAETVKALFTKLWTRDGLLVETGEKMFWDRGTLYALRGAFMAQATDSAYSKLIQYTCQRLLGEHVPYPVEAWPEGNQAHLAAESALYCRIFTEGLFGILPTGIRTFECSPRLPKVWNRMELNHIRAFQQDFTILVERKKDNLKVSVTNFGKLVYSREGPEGFSHQISFEPPVPAKKTMQDEKN
jgi:hypothetical protein